MLRGVPGKFGEDTDEVGVGAGRAFLGVEGLYVWQR